MGSRNKGRCCVFAEPLFGGVSAYPLRESFYPALDISRPPAFTPGVDDNGGGKALRVLCGKLPDCALSESATRGDLLHVNH